VFFKKEPYFLFLV